MIFPPSPFHSGLPLPNLTAWQFFGTRWQPFGPQVVTPPWMIVPTGNGLASTMVPLRSCCFGFGSGCADGRGGSASAMQSSPLTCWPFGHTSGQMRLLIPRSALIASDDMASGTSIEVSLTNWPHAALVSSLKLPLTSPLKQPTRLSSNCSDRASSWGSGALGTLTADGIAAISRSASDRCALFGNSAMNCRSWSEVLAVFH